jgi:hypothetical protein
MSAYISIRQHTSAYGSIRQHTAAYGSIREHTSAHVSKQSVPAASISEEASSVPPSAPMLLSCQRLLRQYLYCCTSKASAFVLVKPAASRPQRRCSRPASRPALQLCCNSVAPLLHLCCSSMNASDCKSTRVSRKLRRLCFAPSSALIDP